jgi:hypothetical protein
MKFFALNFAPGKDANEPSQNFRLFKHNITSSLDESANMFKDWTIEKIAAADIFASSQAHNTFRFFITNEKGDVIIQVSTYYRCSS